MNSLQIKVIEHPVLFLFLEECSSLVKQVQIGIGKIQVRCLE